jgi:hypothetical protein
MVSPMRHPELEEVKMSKERFTDVTEEEAFDCYRRMEKPTSTAVADHFTQLGRNLSCVQVKRWANKGNWGARLDLTSAISVIDPATVIIELAKLASEPTEQVKRGLVNRAIIRLTLATDQLEVRDIGDVARLNDLAAELLEDCSPAAPEAEKPPQRTYTFAPFVRAERK